MSDLSDTIKGFYSDFILRDLLSFVTPGAIIIGTIAFGLNLETYMRDSIFIWILLFGVFYIIGIGLQFVREQIPQLKFPPEMYQNRFRDSNGEIIPDDNRNSDDKNKITPYEEKFGSDEKSRNAKYYQKFRLPFINTVHEKEMVSKVHERFIVIMQASGNSAIAFIVAFLIGLAKLTLLYTNPSDSQISIWIIFSIVCLILSIILSYNFILHQQRLLDWELETIKFYDP